MVLQAKAWRGTAEAVHLELHESLVGLGVEPEHVCLKEERSNFYKSKVGVKQAKSMAAILVGNAEQ